MNSPIIILDRVRELLKKRKELRYLVSGAASEAIELGSFMILFAALGRLYLANSLSFLLGVLSGFVFHKLWSFAGEHRFKTRYQLFSYIALAGVNFVAINILVGYFVNHLHFHPTIAKFFAICITVTWTFVITNRFIFRHKDHESEPINH